MKALIIKYTTWLNNIKHNRSEEGHTWSDDTMNEVDARVRELAEIITDLKELAGDDIEIHFRK